MKDSIFGETLPLAAVKKKKKRLTRKALVIRIGILCGLLVLVSSGAIFGLVQYQQYGKEVAQAQAGVQHLRKAETLLSTLSKNPFDSWSVNQAQQEFNSASSLFQQVSIDLNALPGISASIPGVGSKLAAAQHILPLAIEVSHMGELAGETGSV